MTEKRSGGRHREAAGATHETAGAAHEAAGDIAKRRPRLPPPLQIAVCGDMNYGAIATGNRPILIRCAEHHPTGNSRLVIRQSSNITARFEV